jgi:hypothetical protein
MRTEVWSPHRAAASYEPARAAQAMWIRIACNERNWWLALSVATAFGLFAVYLT